MDAITHNKQRNEIINSLRKLECLITQPKLHRILYARTQMKTFSILHDTFEQRLKALDTRSTNSGTCYAKK